MLRAQRASLPNFVLISLSFCPLNGTFNSVKSYQHAPLENDPPLFCVIRIVNRFG